MNDILNRIRNNCRFLTTLDLSNKNIKDKIKKEHEETKSRNKNQETDSPEKIKKQK